MLQPGAVHAGSARRVLDPHAQQHQPFCVRQQAEAASGGPCGAPERERGCGGPCRPRAQSVHQVPVDLLGIGIGRGGPGRQPSGQWGRQAQGPPPAGQRVHRLAELLQPAAATRGKDTELIREEIRSGAPEGHGRVAGCGTGQSAEGRRIPAHRWWADCWSCRLGAGRAAASGGCRCCLAALLGAS